jgi:hypothetical protein
MREGPRRAWTRLQRTRPALGRQPLRAEQAEQLDTLDPQWLVCNSGKVPTLPASGWEVTGRSGSPSRPHPRSAPLRPAPLLDIVE